VQGGEVFVLAVGVGIEMRMGMRMMAATNERGASPQEEKQRQEQLT
jgi:hypothetical protein